MNWKLLLLLSLLGLAMGLATISLVGQRIEPACWLVVFVFCAWMIVRQSPGRFFLHGFVLGLLNCVWVTGAHVLFFNTYMANHPQMVEMSHKMPFPYHPKWGMLLMAPFVGIASGIVIGLITLLVKAIVGRKPAPAI